MEVEERPPPSSGVPTFKHSRRASPNGRRRRRKKGGDDNSTRAPSSSRVGGVGLSPAVHFRVSVSEGGQGKERKGTVSAEEAGKEEEKRNRTGDSLAKSAFAENVSGREERDSQTVTDKKKKPRKGNCLLLSPYPSNQQRGGGVRRRKEGRGDR